MEPVYRTVIGICLATFKVKRWDVRVTGAENIPTSAGAVIATNHISYVDFVFVGYGVRLGTPDKRLVRFAAKRETFDHKVSGPLMRAMKHIPVDRGGAASQAIDTSVEYLRAGELVGMFPESTISQSFVPLPGKSGTVRMAQLAGVPIIPGAVWGTQRIMTKGHPRDFRPNVAMTVDFGEPLHVAADDDPAAATDELMARIGTLTDAAQRSYPQTPAADENPWWVPAHLGGTAPTPEEARRIAEEEAARRREQRAARDPGAA